MKKAALVVIIAIASLSGYSQVQISDSLEEILSGHEGKITALDERVLINESDLGKLTKIKVSGYVQAQWEKYGTDLVKKNDPDNTFYIRRARVKFTYELSDGVKFVLQPDFSTGNFSLKDAYAVVNIPKVRNVTLWVGQFNRPDYEVEYSSGQREVFERSRVIRSVYPGEREVGVKIEYVGSELPLKVQLMAMNGNFTGNQAKDIDSKKDIMARAVYSLHLPGAGIGIDFGVNGYFGGNRAKTNEYVLNTLGTIDTTFAGHYLDKKWAGGEMQVFIDFLGGMALKAEYLSGVNSTPSTIAVTATADAKLADPNKVRNFSGYYFYLLKNVGQRNQIVGRYDFYDPNSKLEGDAAGKDLYYKTLTLAWQYYLNDNIRISLNYEMPKNEINISAPADLKDNTLGVRVQAKF